jgi:hypothetical protein
LPEVPAAVVSVEDFTGVVSRGVGFAGMVSRDVVFAGTVSLGGAFWVVSCEKLLTENRKKTQ